MANKIKYVVNESSAKDWDNGRWVNVPKFQLIGNGEIICEMKPGFLMENVARLRFQEMAKRFTEHPFEIDLKK